MAYAVSLQSFHGPLDLLLYLVRKHEVDVFDIPIAQLADQFQEYLRVVRTLDVEQAGDFLVVAATLMEIKSRMLLPRVPAEAGEEPVDPRRELVRQLLEYRKFKDAATALEERAERRAAHVPRREVPEPAAKVEQALRPVELWDLVSAFARLMRETQAHETTTIAVDDTPQHVYEEQVRRRVLEGGRVPFRDLFLPPHHRARLIGLFLAVLELIKGRGVRLDQPVPFGDIWLTAVPADTGTSEEAPAGE